MTHHMVARLRSNARCFGLHKLGGRTTIEPDFCAETAEWFNEAADEIERLRKQRDEARREVCRSYANPGGSVFLQAERRGWDCYKGGPDDQ